MDTFFQKLSPWKFVMFILVWFLSTGIIGILLVYATPRYGEFLVAVVAYFIMYYGIKIFGLSRSDEIAIRKEPKEKGSNHGILIFIPFLAGGLVSVLFVLFIQKFIPKFYDMYVNQPDLLKGMNFKDYPVEITLLFIAVVILAPIVEEFIFRGVFFNLLSKKKSTTFAIVVSSLFFGALHFVTVVPTAVIGFVLAFIYHKTGSLRLVIFGHMANNFFAFMVSVLSVSITSNLVVQGILGGVLIILYLIGTIYFLRYTAKNKDYFQKETPLYRLNSTNGENFPSQRPVRIIDISTQIESGMKVYPGDPEVKITEVSTVEEDGFSVRKIEMNTHAGTHVDYPNHYLPSIGEASQDLSIFYGETQVLMTFEDRVEGSLRVLARNGVLTIERAREMTEQGLLLVGTSGESIETRGEDQVHKFLLSKGIYILENLELAQVMPGVYTLAAFPLKIKEADASPVRAVLIDDVHRRF